MEERLTLQEEEYKAIKNEHFSQMRDEIRKLREDTDGGLMFTKMGEKVEQL